MLTAMETPLPAAVVFDNDGLLLDTESVWSRAEQDLFERRGLDFTPQHKHELVGTSAEIAGGILERRLGMTEVSVAHHGRALATYPSVLPFLRLDRIYVRGFRVAASKVHRGKPWSMLSDHLAVSADIERG